MSPTRNRHAEVAVTFFSFFSAVLLVIGAGYLTLSDPLFRAMMRLSRQSDLLSHRYVGDISPERVFADGWRGMQQAIPFRVELVSDSAAVSQPSDQNDWGLTLSFGAGNAEVLAVALRSPFYGILRRDDRLISVGELTGDLRLKLRTYLDENVDESLLVYFEREGIRDSATVALRLDMPRTAFTWSMIDSVRYCSIARFETGLSEAIGDSIGVPAYGSASGLIVDLRDSDGGLREEADKIADLLASPQQPLPIVLLVNASTGNEAEFLAWRLLGSGRATAIGSPTRGTVSKAEEIYLWSGSKLHVSTPDRTPIRLDSDTVVSDTSASSPGGDSASSSGRIVPRMGCDSPTIPGLVFDLVSRDFLLEFVAATSYDALPSTDSESQLYNEFVSYLASRGYRYDPTGEALRDLEGHLLSREMRGYVEDMRQTQRRIVPEKVDNYRSEIIRYLLVAIQQVRIGGMPTPADRLRLDDYCLQAAVAYLSGKKA